MASPLLSVPELKVALGVAATETEYDQRYEQLIDDMQALFEGECGRTKRPFTLALASRTEVYDGTGDCELVLDYPIEALTSVLIGGNPADPRETLDVDDLDVLRYGEGDARLSRVDGGVFGARGERRVVHVTYDAAADAPPKAKAAVLAACKVLIARWGSEGVSAERIGGYSIDYASFVTADMANDPVWKLGVLSCRDRLV